MLQILTDRPIVRLIVNSIPQNIQRFVGQFVFLLLIMAVWRAVFLIFQGPDLIASNSLLYLRSFYIGLRLDLVIGAYFILPLFILDWFRLIPRLEQVVGRITRHYLVAIAALLSFMSIIDLYFYEEFNSHLNLLVFQANVVRSETFRYIWEQYAVIRIILVLGGISWGVYKLLSWLEKRAVQSRKGWKSQLTAGIISLVFLVLAIRGGWQERPIDWGHAMFSDDFTANQIALNGIFLLGRSAVQLSSEQSLQKSLNHFDDQQALEDTKALLLGPGEAYTNPFNLERVITDPTPIQPNIVLVILESHLGSLCGYINPTEVGVTPVLDSLAHNGLAFDRCYANGSRSAFGISSILMSWPVLPGLPLISQMESSRGAPSLANYLRQIGYQNIFLYGGDSQFDNMEGFAKANGYDQVIDDDDLDEPEGTMWGIFDHHMFDESLELLDSATTPLQLTLFTTSNHQPWEVPGDYASRIPPFEDTDFRSGKVHRTMSYVDLALGEFMEQASSKPWFENTLFVFVADHGLTRYRQQFEDLRNGHIPWVIYSPKIIQESLLISAPVSQMDIMPTLFGIIDYPLPYTAMGRDALTNATAFAPRITNDYFVWVEDDFQYGELLNQNSELHRIRDPLQMERESIDAKGPKFLYYQNRHRKFLQTAFTQFKAFGE